MKPINPHLYNALQQKFGKVRITNNGTEATYQVVSDLSSLENPSIPKKINILNWGETYSVNCPKCHDKRSRLYIGHIWGTKCVEANRRIYSCIKCHNEGCNWSDLWEALYETNYKKFPINADTLKTGIDVESRKMELPGEVEDITPVNQLGRSHPAVEYLVSRGFQDINLLAKEYQFCYCSKSPWKKEVKDSAGKVHLITPENRLIIPNVQNGIWKGWMARYIGPIPTDPTTNKPLVQKYLNAPGYSFGASLYRIEVANAFTEGKFCIVCEGALSAVACGSAAVATFGMYPKPMQEELLIRTFSTGKIIVMVESEAAKNKKIYECIARLNSKVANGCVAVDMPSGQDPATIPPEQLFKMIEAVM